MMPRKSSSKKGQITSLSTVLIVIVIIVLVFSTYVWGRGMLDQYEARTSANYAQGKLLELRTDILEVLHDGSNSTRVMQFDAGEGKLGILEGPSCSGSMPGANGIFYELETERQLIDSTEDKWILIDPTDDSFACTASYDSHYSGVLLTKGNVGGVAKQYTTDYMLWFRNLTAADTYAVKISAGSVVEVSGGTHTIVIKNLGTTSSTPYVTTIRVDIQ